MRFKRLLKKISIECEPYSMNSEPVKVSYLRNDIHETALEDKLEQKKVEARKWLEGYGNNPGKEDWELELGLKKSQQNKKKNVCKKYFRKLGQRLDSGALRFFFNLDAYRNNGTNNKNLGCP